MRFRFLTRLPSITRSTSIRSAVQLGKRIYPELFGYLYAGEELRDARFVVEMTYSGNLQRRMRRADRMGARAAVIIGEDEVAAGTATLRDLDSGAQEAVPLDELPARLKALYG